MKERKCAMQIVIRDKTTAEVRLEAATLGLLMVLIEDAMAVAAATGDVVLVTVDTLPPGIGLCPVATHGDILSAGDAGSDGPI